MNRVAVSAFGETRFSRDDLPVAGIMLEAVRRMLLDSPWVDRRGIDAVLVSTSDDSKHLGAVVADMAGIRPRAAHRVESMCSSGTSAIVSAYSYIASGLGDAALVVGADRFDCPGQVLGWDAARGAFKHPVFWASVLSRSYKDLAGAGAEEDLASVAAKNRRNARDNPNAASGSDCSIGDVLGSRRVTEDLRVLECSRPSTGAAAVLLTSEEAAPAGGGPPPVWIAGIGQRTESARFAEAGDFARIRSTADASRQALGMAGVDPGDVDVAEVHDAFAVCEAMAVEGIGLAGEGEGARFCRRLYETQSRMVNPRGGLIGAGHPLGATGVAQAAEIARQLQGGAGRRQAGSPEVGLVHNMSAAATSSTVLVMRR